MILILLAIIFGIFIGVIAEKIKASRVKRELISEKEERKELISEKEERKELISEKEDLVNNKVISKLERKKEKKKSILPHLPYNSLALNREKKIIPRIIEDISPKISTVKVLSRVDIVDPLQDEAFSIFASPNIEDPLPDINTFSAFARSMNIANAEDSLPVGDVKLSMSTLNLESFRRPLSPCRNAFDKTSSKICDESSETMI